jgi:hypothetical protein
LGLTENGNGERILQPVGGKRNFATGQHKADVGLHLHLSLEPGQGHAAGQVMNVVQNEGIAGPDKGGQAGTQRGHIGIGYGQGEQVGINPLGHQLLQERCFAKASRGRYDNVPVIQRFLYLFNQPGARYRKGHPSAPRSG